MPTETEIEEIKYVHAQKVDAAGKSSDEVQEEITDQEPIEQLVHIVADLQVKEISHEEVMEQRNDQEQYMISFFEQTEEEVLAESGGVPASYNVSVVDEGSFIFLTDDESNYVAEPEEEKRADVLSLFGYDSLDSLIWFFWYYKNRFLSSREGSIQRSFVPNNLYLFLAMRP